MNFISTFDELNKLYENAAKAKKPTKKSDDAELTEGDDYRRDHTYADYHGSTSNCGNKFKRKQSDYFNKSINSLEFSEESADASDDLTEATNYNEISNEKELINVLRKSIASRKNILIYCSYGARHTILNYVRQLATVRVNYQELFGESIHRVRKFFKSDSDAVAAASGITVIARLENLDGGSKEEQVGIDAKLRTEILECLDNNYVVGIAHNKVTQEILDKFDTEFEYIDSLGMGMNNRRALESYPTEELAEAADEEEIEIADDEIPEEAAVEDNVTDKPVVEEEPRQVILECDKCGALVIKSEDDIVVDEESDLVNVEDECQFCEEAEGFKIIGVVVPYEVAAADIEEPVEESLHNSELLKEIEKTNELKTEHESEYLTLNEEAEDIIDEDLADVFRKKLDRPASVKTQQRWEEELTDLQLELEHETDERKKAKIEKRIKQLEDKFLQQRDLEASHVKKDEADELEELLDLNVPVNVTANGNDVAVGGMT